MFRLLICVVFTHGGLFDLICGNVHSHLFTVFAFSDQALLYENLQQSKDINKNCGEW